MRTKAEQEAIQAILAKLADENGGRLTPDAVVAHAQRKDSPLHELFEWDTKKAAHAWRLEQARELIRSVRVVITTERTTISTVAYIRDPDAAPGDQGYVETVRLAHDADRARAALVEEFGRAASALRRAREIAVAFEMENEIEAVAESVDTMRTKVEARTEHRQES